jgi:cell wall-associated NlpC family hydrolase
MVVAAAALLIAAPASFAGQQQAPTDVSGGTQAAPPPPGPPPADVQPGAQIPGSRAKIGPDGLALAPADAPDQVKYAIWAGNQLVGLPYHYGGGHATFRDSGYDCSGTVSYALHGAGLLQAPMDSNDLEGWGDSGQGQWITVYTNPGHAYAVIAGIRLDTSKAGDPRGQDGPRWRKRLRSNAGYDSRHTWGL